MSESAGVMRKAFDEWHKSFYGTYPPLVIDNEYTIHEWRVWCEAWRASKRSKG